MLQHIILLRNQKKDERFIYRRTDERFKFYYDLKKLFYFKDINYLTEEKIDDVRKNW